MANQITIGDTTFHVGDTINVHYRLIEKEKVAGKTKREVKEEVRERIQIFEGLVIDIHGRSDNKSYTVRRIGTNKIGVERIFPAISPWVKHIDIKERGSAKRAKLFYTRDRIGREAERLTNPDKKLVPDKKSQHKKIIKKPDAQPKKKSK